MTKRVAIKQGTPAGVVRWHGTTPELVEGIYRGATDSHWLLDYQGQRVGFKREDWELCLR